MNSQVKQYFELKHLTIFWGFLALAGLHVSPALSSVSIAILIFLGILQWSIKDKFKFQNNIPPFIWAFVGLFLWQIATAFANGPVQIHLDNLLLKAPILFLPFLYLALKKILPHQLLFFSAVSLIFSWTNLASVINYFQNSAFYSAMVAESKPVPIFSSIYHIEYSVANGFVILSAIVVLWKNKAHKASLLWAILFVCSILNFASMHILAARTGLVSLYLGLCLYLFLNFNKKQILIGTILLIAGGGASLVVPSVRNRVENTITDAKSVINQEDVTHKSFGLRTKAWSAAVLCIQSNGIFGAGPNGTKVAMLKSYQIQKSTLELSMQKMPHNQYLDFGVQSGFVGMALFCISLFLVFFQLNNVGKSIVIYLGIACIFESLLERQAGLVYSLLMLCWAGVVDLKEKK